MRYLTSILFALLAICSWSSFNTVQNQKNPLYGKIFREINEIPGLASYAHASGAVIDASKSESGDYRFAAGYYTSDKNGICILNELLDDKENGKGQVKYKILDTINIRKLKANEQLSLCNCRIGNKFDSEIVAISVVEEDKEYFNKTLKAWRLNTKTGKIDPIQNTKTINCANEGYGI
ncbi:hypothetical protein [Sphingobacterium detergens]|nr:hypothetical protein [Sphingobacterium detergens]